MGCYKGTARLREKKKKSFHSDTSFQPAGQSKQRDQMASGDARPLPNGCSKKLTRIHRLHIKFAFSRASCTRRHTEGGIVQ